MPNISLEGYTVHHAALAVFLAWLIAQMVKVITGIVQDKRFDIRLFVRTGGMPSSHSSVVACTATIAGYEFGFDSVLFLIILIFAMIVMVDAAGFRRAAGKQAKVLNQLLGDFYESGTVMDGQLIELLGHTILEVAAGTVLGITMAILFHV